MEIEYFTIKDIFNIIKKRAIFIILVSIIFAGAGLVIGKKTIKDSYLTCCKLFVGVEMDKDKESSIAYFQSMYSLQQFVDSYEGILTSYDVINECIEGTDIENDAGSILKDLKIKHEEDQQVLELSIITKEPFEGEKILNSIVNKFGEISKKYIPLGKVDVVSKPLISPVNIKSKQMIYIVGGFAIGLLISITISFILYYLDDSIKSEEEVLKIFNSKVIGEIPKVKDLNV